MARLRPLKPFFEKSKLHSANTDAKGQGLDGEPETICQECVEIFEEKMEGRTEAQVAERWMPEKGEY